MGKTWTIFSAVEPSHDGPELPVSAEYLSVINTNVTLNTESQSQKALRPHPYCYRTMKFPCLHTPFLFSVHNILENSNILLPPQEGTTI